MEITMLIIFLIALGGFIYYLLPKKGSCCSNKSKKAKICQHKNKTS